MYAELRYDIRNAIFYLASVMIFIIAFFSVSFAQKKEKKDEQIEKIGILSCFGDAAGDGGGFGSSVDISDDGSVIAVGAPNHIQNHGGNCAES